MMNIPPTVWIVDDDPDDQFFFKQAFKEVIPVIRIRQLEDGDELLPSLKTAPDLPKLILLDLNMPRQNGFETLMELRSIPAYQNLAVVVLTTSAHPEDREKSLQLGANGFLTKPPSTTEIVQMLRQLAADWQLN